MASLGLGAGLGGYSPYAALRPPVNPLSADATGLGGVGSTGLLGGAGSVGLLGGAPTASPLSARSALAGPGAAGGGDPMIQLMSAVVQLVQACMTLMSGGAAAGANPFGSALDGAQTAAPGATGATGNTGNTGNTGAAAKPPAAAAGGGGGGGGY